MKKHISSAAVFLGLSFFLANALGADVRELVMHPDKYYGQRITVTGLARVPGNFYLFDDVSAAAKRDTSKALFIVQKSEVGYTGGLDRKWVRITGVVRSIQGGLEDSRCAIEAEKIDPISDNPDSRIEDPIIYGAFENALAADIVVELYHKNDSPYTKFYIGPHASSRVSVQPGSAKVYSLEGPQNAPVWERVKRKLVVEAEIQFPKLPPKYVYSAADSNERTLYYRITTGKIELIPASEAKPWKAN